MYNIVRLHLTASIDFSQNDTQFFSLAALYVLKNDDIRGQPQKGKLPKTRWPSRLAKIDVEKKV